MTVHRQYLRPGMVAFEDLPPSELLICIGDNYARKRVMDEAIERGHNINSWVSMDCLPPYGGYDMVKRNTFLFEHNNFQPYATVGENTVVWAANHIGHHSRIGNHCFITSHVCIGGGAEIGDYSFIGMNATIFDHVKIGAHCIIAAGAVVDRDIPDGHTLSRKGVLVKHEMAQA